ncbi:tripartite tricarboxylate transporter substrate binding protein [Bosea caraganae]|uniref:Tripartite tricarboxylate transporter substrate binding protein n=1 Tax=Bosea caraganae TaxID=2763117 RepID=A0A370L058_9HYPH|nr:tripartite tricarboxylate transporter substrate binding protein [Bosea caraganae]RDJ20644.1 tripartite tricarboxylate transporter substrate binding protein [Bosea caraganae]RDJ28921.1 tripartite tricarboxylate transporter substrate binding protein [Bosea caraganae]
MRKAILLALAGAISFAAAAAAQSFPQKGKPISLIVPSSAGGGTDTATRLLAPLMEKDLGTSVVVVNKPGGSMQVGFGFVAGAKPDGHTLAMLIMPPAQSIYFDPQRKAPFERNSLVPVGMYYGAPFAIVVSAKSPYKTLADLVAAARAEAGKLNGGTTGFMASGHLALLAFEQGTKTKMTAVHYQGGGPLLAALLGGQIDVTFNSIGELLAQKNAGAIRLLALMNDTRDPQIPDVPTVTEAGFTGVAPMGSYIGLAAPAGTPPDIIARLSVSLKKAVDDPILKERMTGLGNTLIFTDPAGANKFWDEADARFKPLIESAPKSQ